MTRVSVYDGKYTFIVSDVGEVECLRYGEPWMVFQEGAKAIMALVARVEELEGGGATEAPAPVLSEGVRGEDLSAPRVFTDEEQAALPPCDDCGDRGRTVLHGASGIRLCIGGRHDYAGKKRRALEKAQRDFAAGEPKPATPLQAPAGLSSLPPKGETQPMGSCGVPQGHQPGCWLAPEPKSDPRNPASEAERRKWSTITTGRPWPLSDVLERLANAADHLLRDHNCDEHGHEETKAARDAAREIAASLFGDGSDGSVVLTSPVSLTRDHYFEDVLMGASIDPNGFSIFVSGGIHGEIASGASSLVPRCPHGEALLDHAGGRLEPACGCRALS